MRILYLTAETWPTFRADVAVLFGKRLPELGIASDLVAGRTPEGGGPAAWPAGESVLCDVGAGRASRHWRIVSHGIRTMWRAPAGRYQAIQVRDMPVVAAFGLVIARLKRLPFFYWMSYPMPEWQITLARQRGLSAGWFKFLWPWTSGRVGRFLMRHWVLPRADHVFVQSPRMKQELQQLGVPAERMTPVQMGVDLAQLDALAGPAMADPRLEGATVIGYLGTLDLPRQIERLFEMLALVRRRVGNAVLLLVGDTEDPLHREWLRGQALAAGVADHVIWTGWQPTEVAWRWLRSSTVVLSPFPRGELLDSASPTKVPEYMALRLPVVCNDNPDQEEAVRASGAGLCVPYTAHDFAEAVLDLLARTPAERAAMGEAGRRYVQARRDYPHLAASLATRYRHLLGESRT